MAAMTDLAQLHRPDDRATLRAEALELRARGLTPRDIASALQLPEGAVRELLGLQRGQTSPLQRDV